LTFSNEDIRFTVREQADAFVSREVGRRVRARLRELDRQAPRDRRIAITFDGVDVITPSFVDECLGKLVSTLGVEAFRRRFVIRADRPEWRNLINAVVRNRIQLDDAAGLPASPEIGQTGS